MALSFATVSKGCLWGQAFIIMSEKTSDTETRLTSRERFLKAARREAVDRPPIWFMRQAGRYLPEYRKLRERGTFLDAVHDPELRG